MQRVGSRAQVMHGNAKQTGGGLKKRDLKYNKQGKIVSKKMSAMAKKEKRLQKAGYTTKKGQFGAVRNMRGGDHDYLISKDGINTFDVKVNNKATKIKNWNTTVQFRVEQSDDDIVSGVQILLGLGDGQRKVLTVVKSNQVRETTSVSHDPNLLIFGPPSNEYRIKFKDNNVAQFIKTEVQSHVYL